MTCALHPSREQCPICEPLVIDAPPDFGHGDCEHGQCDRCDETAALARMWDEVPL